MYMRIPILDTIKRSPFDGLMQHANKVKECIKTLVEAVDVYINQDWGNFEKLSKQVQKLEHEADLIKGNISAHLPKGIRMPVFKSDFMMCLRDQDAILDFAEDTVIWLGFRKTDLSLFRKEFMEHLHKVIEAVKTLEEVVANIKGYFSWFKKNKRENMKNLIKRVHRLEWEADEIEKDLARRVFNSNLDFLSIFHILKVITLIAQIANRAENAGDRIRAMIAK